ncbi:hypothetical protein SSX86_008305 [Deinandra increscens subsp. villosa]|uniref:tRNA (adenine(58)-N(1))-methyltransferase non-catalytic subunit TRM6 n=1 Tax=Deinandra increscens subsp. villosa TaxID=3103831 RepID=A0AAP0DB14_9ASTR
MAAPPLTSDGHRVDVVRDGRISRITSTIHVIPDFPKPGILFQDITTLLLEPLAFKDTIDLFVERVDVRRGIRASSCGDGRDAVIVGSFSELDDFYFAAVCDGYAGFSFVTLSVYLHWEFDNDHANHREELYKECAKALQGGQLLNKKHIIGIKNALQEAFDNVDAKLLNWLEMSREDDESGATSSTTRKSSLFLLSNRSFYIIERCIRRPANVMNLGFKGLTLEKEKYRLKKQKKYAPKVILRRPFARSICDIYIKKYPARIGFLRVDTLSLLLSFGNVMAQSDVLVVDMIGGLLIGAVAERLGGTGFVCNTYRGDSPHSTEIVRIFNFSDEINRRIVRLPFAELSAPEDVDSKEQSVLQAANNIDNPSNKSDVS